MKHEVISACRHLLRPIVRLLIRCGISWREFAELGKEVFVDVSGRDYGLQGRPTNAARVALMTGLSRREVSRVRRVISGQARTEPPPSRISQILTGWHVDPDFLDSAGRPAALAVAGRDGSIEALFDRYAGDMPHGALLKEMQQLGLVVEEGGHYRVTAREYIRTAADPNMLQQAGRAIHDHAVTVFHNVNSERSSPPRFERMATRSDLDPRTVEAFQALLAERGQEFLEEMDRWLAERDIPIDRTEKRRKTVRAGVGVYLILDEAREVHEEHA